MDYHSRFLCWNRNKLSLIGQYESNIKKFKMAFHGLPYDIASFTVDKEKIDAKNEATINVEFKSIEVS